MFQIESSGHHITTTPGLSLIASGSGSNGLVAMSEATLAAAASGGMVVQETAEGGLMLVDAQGNTLKLEHTADGMVAAAEGEEVAVDAATGGEVHHGTVEAGTLEDAVTWTLHGEWEIRGDLGGGEERGESRYGGIREILKLHQ